MDNEKPIFVQIVEMIEADILAGTYGVDDLIISTPQISKLLNVNPTTAQKAISVLQDRGIVYKKRGVGMAVTAQAREIITTKRRADFFGRLVPEFVRGARVLGIADAELLRIIEEQLHDQA